MVTVEESDDSEEGEVIDDEVEDIEDSDVVEEEGDSDGEGIGNVAYDELANRPPPAETKTKKAKANTQSTKRSTTTIKATPSSKSVPKLTLQETASRNEVLPTSGSSAEITKIVTPNKEIAAPAKKLTINTDPMENGLNTEVASDNVKEMASKNIEVPKGASNGGTTAKKHPSKRKATTTGEKTSRSRKSAPKKPKVSDKLENGLVGHGNAMLPPNVAEGAVVVSKQQLLQTAQCTREFGGILRKMLHNHEQMCRDIESLITQVDKQCQQIDIMQLCAYVKQ